MFCEKECVYGVYNGEPSVSIEVGATVIVEQIKKALAAFALINVLIVLFSQIFRTKISVHLS